MNIQEAIKTGLPFRRKTQAQGGWITKQHSSMSESFAFFLEDLLADDWEVQEKSATVTKASLIQAVKDYETKHPWYFNPSRDRLFSIQMMFDILGLE